MPRHQLSKLELLEYALHGAARLRRLQSGNLSEEEEDLLDSDIAEIERRIKLVKARAAARRKEQAVSNKKTPEQIVAELRADPLRWMNDWSESDEPVIGLDGAYTLDELRAIVAVREKQLGLPDPIQEAARKCAKIVRNACAFEDWQEPGYDAAEQIEREFGITKGTQK